MNVKRGLIRLWVLFSAVWCFSLLGLSASDWYHATSYWYRSHGFEVARCKPWERYSLQSVVPKSKQEAAKPDTQKNPLDEFGAPAAPNAETSGSTPRHLRLSDVIGSPNAPPKLPDVNDDVPTTAPDCFHVTVPGGLKYLVEVKRGSWNVESIKDVVLYNPALFPKSQAKSRPAVWQPPTGDEIVVDLTQGDPRPDTGGFLISGNVYDHPDLKMAISSTGLAFLVPIVVFILGSGIYWVAMGFKS